MTVGVEFRVRGDGWELVAHAAGEASAPAAARRLRSLGLEAAARGSAVFVNAHAGKWPAWLADKYPSA